MAFLRPAAVMLLLAGVCMGEIALEGSSAPLLGHGIVASGSSAPWGHTRPVKRWLCCMCHKTGRVAAMNALRRLWERWRCHRLAVTGASHLAQRQGSPTCRSCRWRLCRGRLQCRPAFVRMSLTLSLTCPLQARCRPPLSPPLPPRPRPPRPRPQLPRPPQQQQPPPPPMM